MVLGFFGLKIPHPRHIQLHSKTTTTTLSPTPQYPPPLFPTAICNGTPKTEPQWLSFQVSVPDPLPPLGQPNTAPPHHCHLSPSISTRSRQVLAGPITICRLAMPVANWYAIRLFATRPVRLSSRRMSYPFTSPWICITCSPFTERN